jgi:hypothetical protein
MAQGGIQGRDQSRFKFKFGKRKDVMNDMVTTENLE